MSYTPRPDIIWHELKTLAQQVKQLLTQSPLGYSSITRGSLRVASNEGLIVDGSAKVTGYLVVTGTLRGTGTFEWLGTMNISGAQNVTGPTTFSGSVTVTGEWTQNGVWHLNGDGDITGDVGVTGDVTILPGGKLQVGDMIIDPSDGGSVTFPGGAVVHAGSSGGIEMRDGSYAAVVTDSGASVGRLGRAITVSESGFRMDGLPSGSPGNGTAAGVLYEDGLGYLKVSDGT